MRDPLFLWLAAGWVAVLLLPWYAVDPSFWSFDWLTALGESATAPAILQATLHGRVWLLPAILAFVPPLLVLRRRRDDATASAILLASGACGLAWLAIEGFAIGIRGWSFAGLEAVFGPVEPQPGMGYGALVAGTAFLFLLTTGIARRGTMRGDAFVVSSIGLVIASIGLFVFFPVAKVLAAAGLDANGGVSAAAFLTRLSAADIWNLSCLAGGRSCGVFWNSLALAVVVGLLTTLLGLAFALLAFRTGFRAKRLLNVLAVLPVITPPFVIGLGIILLFGRSGVATVAFADWFGIRPGRWIYGFNGLVLVQVLAFTPIAYLVMAGVVQGGEPFHGGGGADPPG